MYPPFCTHAKNLDKSLVLSIAIVGSKSDYTLDYDVLIVAVGADNQTFNIPGVRENCHFLKTVEDACKLRNTVMDWFETAAIPGQPQQEVERLLHFVVVGAGPTGEGFIV